MHRSHSVAIIGAGITGSLAALSLADRGHKVLLFDRAEAPMSGASRINEGKIHLGFVYVNDPTSRTIDVMVESAIQFRSLLERHIPGAAFEAAITEPFEYIVPEDSQLAPEILDRKFAQVANKIQAAEKRFQTRYLGVDYPVIWSRCSEIDDLYDRNRIIARYRTMERSVDTRVIADAVVEALVAHTNIELHLKTHIDHVSKEKAHWRLEGIRDNRRQVYSPFTYVINSSWEGRPAIDEQVFGADPVHWFHRYKHALILQPETPNHIRNFTAVIGTYGDIVQYPSGRVYLSYYPAGMLSSSDTIEGVQTRYSEETRHRIARETLRGLSRFVPSVESVYAPCNPGAEHVAGGIIMARGKTDIDDRESELHQRYRIGLRHSDGFFSIDTGKYTSGPAFAEAAVQQILG